MKRFFMVVIICIGLAVICSGAWAGGGRETQESIAGIYTGVIPAADCPGISVVAILGPDVRYKITYQYIDRDVELFTSAGTFSYDAKTKIITLSGGERPSFYKAGKNSITQLDMEGNEIKGDLARNYVLRKL